MDYGSARKDQPVWSSRASLRPDGTNMRYLPAPLLRLRSAANSCCMAFALGACVFPADAAQSGEQFNVKVKLQTGSGTTAGGPTGGGTTGDGLCRNTAGADAFGAQVTVVCSTGTMVNISPGRTGAPWSPMHGGAYRFITQVTWNGDLIDSVDNAPGAGTITSWRAVNLVDRSYFEMTVGW